MPGPASTFPFPDAPANGTTLPVAPGIVWLRLALPFRLNHVNAYLLEDGDGWLLVDTGPGDPATQAVWRALLDGGPGSPLQGRPITRIVVTHHHPDHVGAAGFLATRTGAPLLMGETEYLTTLALLAGDATGAETVRSSFYRLNGARDLQLEALGNHLDRYRALVPTLPSNFLPLRGGDHLRVGDRTLSVLDCPGHAPAQMILHDAASNLLLAADQVMTRISPNIGVGDRTPQDDPLGRFLASLERLRRLVPDGGLVLPGHHLPFRTLHSRIGELEAHHETRCDAIEQACAAGKGLTVAELVPLLFPFELDAHQFWFAFSEILAHLNRLARQGRVEARDSHGRRRWGKVGRPSHTGRVPDDGNGPGGSLRPFAFN